MRSEALGLMLAVLFSAYNGAERAQAEPTSLEKKGRIAYQTYCIACHNTDPKKAGSLGPDVYGSSKELLEARILRAEYPPGYKPKRATRTMAALPHLRGEINAFHAYLNAKRSLMSSSSKEMPAPK